MECFSSWTNSGYQLHTNDLPLLLEQKNLCLAETEIYVLEVNLDPPETRALCYSLSIYWVVYLGIHEHDPNGYYGEECILEHINSAKIIVDLQSIDSTEDCCKSINNP